MDPSRANIDRDRPAGCHHDGMPSEVVSREQECRVVDEFLVKAAVAPAALVLEGEAGIGKTAMWLEGLRRAAESGYVVLSAYASPAEARSTFAAAADLLRDVDQSVLQRLPPLQHDALGRFLRDGADGSPDGSPTEERTVAMALLVVLEILAGDAPLLVAVDDAPWLDVASRAVLGFAARRLKGRVGLLMTARTGRSGVDEMSWLQLSNPEAITRTTIGPLQQDGLCEVITGRLGLTLPRASVERIYQSSGGNPFFAIELARAQSVRPDPSTELPDTLAAVVSRRIGSVDGEAAELLLAVASVSQPTVSLLSGVLDCEAAHVLDLLEGLETLGIIECRFGTVYFMHPLLAHGVSARASDEARRRIHRRLAVLVEDPEMYARHLALSVTSADEETLEALDVAADVAVSRGAPGAAAELLESAIGLGGDTVVRRIRATELHFRAGSLGNARHLLPPMMDTVPEGPLRCLALLLSGAIHAYDNDLTGAAEVMAQALDQAGDVAALGAQCAMRLALCLHMIGRLSEGAQRARLAVSLAEQSGIPGLRSRALSMWVVTTFVSGCGLDDAALQAAVQSEDPDDDATTWFRATAVQAMVTAWTGDLEGGRAQLCAVQQRMRAGGAELDIIWAANHMAMIDVWLGHYAEAAQSVREAVRCAELNGGLQLLISAWNMQAEVAARTGNEAEARSAATASIAGAKKTGAGHLAILPTAALGFLEVSLGDYAAAIETLQSLLATFDPDRDTEFVVGTWVPDAIEALIALGRLGEAEPLIAALENRGVARGRAWTRAVGARARAQLCAARNELDEAEDALREAFTYHEQLAMPFESARTQLVLGQIQRRRRSRGAAIASLSAVVDCFESLGSPLWVARARAELQRSRFGSGAGGELSGIERRTAELAAAGRTNQEIAAELFQSVKTVESNLSRIYRKLQIRSRTQLAARLSSS